MAPTRKQEAREKKTERQAKAKREWLGWQQSVLPAVVEKLLQRFGAGETWDLRELMIVLPGGLALRRLGELLALAAQTHGKILYPPQIVTAGALPEQLYVAKYPFASDLVQHLTWVKALQAAPVDELSRVVPVLPRKSATQQWLELAKMFAGLHRELASDRVNFNTVVATLGEHHPETPRWQALARVQRSYLEQLDALQLWDIQTARLCALEFKEARTDKKILVVGCVDLNRTQRGFLEHVAEHVEIWIAAPESAASHFDALGGLNTATWQEFDLDLPADALLVGNSPSDQAELACACLAELGDRYHAREITLGVPEAGLITELQHHLQQAGVSARYGPGTPLPQSEPAQLLSLIAEYVDTRTFAAFAALIRHPAIPQLLVALRADLPNDWLAQIDDYYQAALPKVVDSFVNDQADGAAVYVTLAKKLNQWLSKLTARPRTISSWVQPLLVALGTAYDKQMCDLDDPIESRLYNSATQICTAILSLRDIPAELEPTMTVSELIDWLLRNLSNSLVPEPPHSSTIEMLGWLELALDDAPALVITGMHDGVVPESVSADAFLPNGLRRQLGMIDNAHRFARDAYALQVLLQSRQFLRIVVGKTDANGDPLVPSRLLMACRLEELPQRVLHLVREDAVDVLPPVAKRWKRVGGLSHLSIPRPANFKTPRQMTVTAFRDYLACPYRFYLRHVLKLRDEHDADAELDAPMFGNLLHDTLQLLGEGDVGRSADEEQVKAFLIETLHAVALQRFGPNPPAAVLIQIEQAEERLAAFAPLQAARAAQGWQIRFTEKGVGIEDRVMLGRDEQLHLIGRIDRIDYHPASGQWAIWDYKTSENAKNPVSVHWSRKDGWKDLQLPLYLPVAQKLGVGPGASLGYIALPKQAADTGFHRAEFSPQQLREAAAVADEIASKVAAGEFWPDKLSAVRYDDFGRICQSNVQRVSIDPPQRSLQRFLSSDHIARSQVAPADVTRALQLLSKPSSSQPKLEPLLIRASAGTGKTFQLTNRLLQIILSGQDVDPILASTFTRKAAGEIMHRVLQRLAQGCCDAAVREELSRHLPDVDTSAANCLAALRRVTRMLHRLRIGTLDSFFAQVARTFSLEMGLPPGWSALDPAREPQYQFAAIAQMLDNQDRRTLISLVRMLAKGESGRQVAEQIRQTVAAGYGAYRITEADAWDQLPLPSPPSEQAVESALRTLEQCRLNHKKADEQLQKLRHEAEVGNWEAVISHGIYTKLEGDAPSYYGRELDSSLVAALELLVQRAAAELLPVRRNQTLASYKVLDAFDQEYTSLIRRQRVLAFADVTYYLARWMDANARHTGNSNRASQLAFRLDCGVEHLLLDEFQDTAPEQWQILRPLAEPLGGQPVSEHSFFCVGDTKQAIYGWRGGVAEIFDAVSDAVADLQQKQMSESFRSSPQVISLVNQVFENLPKHSNYSGCDNVAQRWSQDFPKHRTSRTDLSGYVRVQNGPKVDSKLLIDERKDIFLGFTANQIADLTRHSTASVGVLFRTNADVARMIGLLRNLGVSASQDGGNPLTDSVAVELLLSLIHLADHPGDGVCAFHVATSPLAKHLPFSSQSDPFALGEWFRRECIRRGLGTAIEGVANQLADYLSWWDQHRLEQLIRAAYEFQASFRGRLRDFEDAVLSNRVALPTEAQVKVMTIHKSKGLEFDAVFLPELDIDLSTSANSLLVLRGDDPCQPPDGVLRYMNANLQAMLPADWQRAFDVHKQRGVTESLCLLYVAMTRARQALYMTTRPTSRSGLQDFSSLLQSILTGTSQGAGAISDGEAIVYEEGAEDWYLQSSPRTQVERRPQLAPTAETVSSDTQAEQALAPDLQGDEMPLRLPIDPALAPARGLRLAAPSTVGHAYEPVPLASAFSYSHTIATSYGTLIHAFFQQVQWIENYQFDSTELRRVALATIEPESLRHLNLDGAIEDFQELLGLASVRSILSQTRYRSARYGFVPDQVEIDNERPISLVMDRRLVAGTIDRLAILIKDGKPFAAEIVDFKTDKFDPSMTLLWLEDRMEFHRPQMEVYSQVVSQLFGLPRERIVSHLVMLSTDELITYDHASPPAPHWNSQKKATPAHPHEL